MSDVLAQGEEARARTVHALRTGNLAVVPSDTVYAVIADAFSTQATGKLRELKGGGRSAPLTVLVRSPRQVSGIVEHVPESAERLMASYWPGALTIVFPAADGLTWDIGDTAGTVALRMPADDDLTTLIEAVGPLASSAATRAGSAVASEAASVREQLGDDVAVYVDGGPRSGTPSTVVDVTRDVTHVLRAGAIGADHVLQVAGGTVGWGRRPEDEDEDDE